MKSKLLLSAAPIAMLCAASTMVPTAAMAMGPFTPEQLAIIICSNNGNGNDEEIVTFGVPTPVCEKGMGGDQNKEDEPPGAPGTNEFDPQDGFD